jgi:hypothetical protein
MVRTSPSAAFKSYSILTLLAILATLTLPKSVSAQGLELSGGWAHVTEDFGTDGFGLGAAWGFTKNISVAANYDSTWDSSTIGTFTFTQVGAITVKSHLQNALFGPRVFFSTKSAEKKKVRFFGELEFGASHLNQELVQANMPTISASDTAFSWALGGGAEYMFDSHWSARGNLDFFHTSFANGGQSRLRLVVGVVYAFRAREMKGKPPNHPPVASCSANPAMVYAGSGDTLSVEANASDVDDNPLTYSWTATGGKVQGTGSQVRWDSSGVAIGDYSVTARVDDGRGTTTCQAVLRVEARPTRPPTISCSVSPRSVHPGEPVHIAAAASDPDNDSLTFAWQDNPPWQRRANSW